MKSVAGYLVTFLLLSAVWMSSDLVQAMGIQRALIFDAGSTGTRVYIFEYDFPKGSVVPRVYSPDRILKTDLDPKGSSWSYSIKPGIHTLVNNRKKIDEYLNKIMTFVLGKIPDFKENQPRMQMFFNATAGVRSLSKKDQKSLVDDVAHFFKKLGMKDKRTEVLDGSREGIYSWITINTLLGNINLQKGEFSTVGVLDMGGYSTQVTFVPLELSGKNIIRVSLGSLVYELYTNSFDGFGVRTAIEALSSPDCFNQDIDKKLVDGLVKDFDGVPSGNYQDCKLAIQKRLFDQCSKNQRYCSLKNAEVPRIWGKFFAISGFAFLDRIFRFSRFSSESIDKLGAHICQQKWTDLVESYKDRDKPEFLATSCFEMAYYSSFLSGEYHLPGSRNSGVGFGSDTENIIPVVEIQGISVTSWALGAAVFEIMDGKITHL